MGTTLTELVSAVAKTTPPIGTVIHESLNESLAKNRDTKLKPSYQKASKIVPHPREYSEPDKEARNQNSFDKTVRVACRELPNSEFIMVILQSIESYYERCYIHFKADHKRLLKQTSYYLKISFLLLALAIPISFTGIFLIFTDRLQVGLFITIAGVICEIISLFTFWYYKKTGIKSDQDIHELNTIANLRIATLYVEQITDTERKVEAIERILRNILLLKSDTIVPI